MWSSRRRRPKTLCGLQPRAWVEAHTGNQFTYRFPCGYTCTKTLMVGHGRAAKPAGPEASAFFARYWRQGQGVNYECPRCRRRLSRPQEV